jgi:hypothetical protein
VALLLIVGIATAACALPPDLPPQITVERVSVVDPATGVALRDLTPDQVQWLREAISACTWHHGLLAPPQPRFVFAFLTGAGVSRRLFFDGLELYTGTELGYAWCGLGSTRAYYLRLMASGATAPEGDLGQPPSGPGRAAGHQLSRDPSGRVCDT